MHLEVSVEGKSNQQVITLISYLPKSRTKYLFPFKVKNFKIPKVWVITAKRATAPTRKTTIAKINLIKPSCINSLYYAIQNRDILPNMELPSILAEQLQWSADTSRLMKIALRNHNPQMVTQVMERISEKFGDDFAEEAVARMANHLMNTENWSFFDPETGKPSALL